MDSYPFNVLGKGLPIYGQYYFDTMYETQAWFIRSLAIAC